MTTTRRPFEWLNDDSRLFLSRGYLNDGQSAEDRMKDIAKEAEKTLSIDGFADKFYDYLSKGYYSLSTPVWTNYGNSRGMPISCFGSTPNDSMSSLLYTSS